LQFIEIQKKILFYQNLNMNLTQPRATYSKNAGRLVNMLPLYPMNKKHRVSKRMFDLFVSSIVIVCILSWLLPVLAILLKLDSKGPVFFIQKRRGAGGKLFRCLKLRSMIVNENADVEQASENDPRITRFGNFLRKSCLDELPQFFNVLWGSMSIVGPRPHMISDCEAFKKVIPEYDRRHAVKPGITGIAQVKGYKGQTDSFHDVFHRYQWDIFYVRNAGLMLDLKIIQQTGLQILQAVMKPHASLKKTVSQGQVTSKRSGFLNNFRNQPVEV
jgi:putative colanic acid biosynthesis UDP-glucose lipid carrier transferase